MTFNPLPNLYITWDESAEPLTTFLRYQVYRRLQGETSWVKIARINRRDVTFYNDYCALSTVTYEYMVTQVSDIAGEEVESDPPSPGSGSIELRSIFLHDITNPEFYVEILGETQDLDLQLYTRYLRPLRSSDPIAHIGPQNSRRIRVTMQGTWALRQDVWEAIESLVVRQVEAGAKLMIRQYRNVGYFCQFDGGDRSDRHVMMAVKLEFQKVKHTEAIT